MALLTVLHFPDNRLRTRAKPVTKVNDAIGLIVKNMFETMYEESGIGLAATQVDVHLRIIVVDLSEDKSQPLCLINPELTHTEGHTVGEEGCLSIPDIHEDIPRAEKINVTAMDKNGQLFNLEAEGLLAICIQHEMDHLEGKLFVDYLSPLKRQRIRTKLVKQQRQH